MVLAKLSSHMHGYYISFVGKFGTGKLQAYNCDKRHEVNSSRGRAQPGWLSKGQHVICADPKVLDRHLKAAGREILEVDVSKLIWTPYKEQG